jgi:glyoxylase I family protein
MDGYVHVRASPSQGAGRTLLQIQASRGCALLPEQLAPGWHLHAKVGSEVLAMTCSLTGIDHIYLSVRDMEVSEIFYDRVMEALGLHKGDKPIAGERHAHYIAPAFQFTIRPARSDEPHDPYRAGLHHLCFQAPSRQDVDECYRILQNAGVDATPPKLYPEYNPEYYATFFEDPDGIRLEIVGRTSYRTRIANRWQDFETFLNPLQALDERASER